MLRYPIVTTNDCERIDRFRTISLLIIDRCQCRYVLPSVRIVTNANNLRYLLCKDSTPRLGLVRLLPEADLSHCISD